MIHRFIGKFPISEKRFWISDKEFAHQVRDVLRLEPGEKVILSDGLGSETEAEVLSFDKGAVEVRTLTGLSASKEPSTRATLYLAILKKENFELAAQKAVECGVSRIVPVITERTVKLGIREDRLEKIIKEAAEQSGRARLPELSAEMEYKEALVDASSNDLNIFFGIGERSLELENKYKGGKIGIFIGPEGGWTEKEKEMAKLAKFILAGLGDLTLRAETAAIVATHALIFDLEK